MSWHASFDRWWNGISLRAKITGVTVLLLTFGLTVAGAGTMTVLRTYLLEQTDQQIAAAYEKLGNRIDLETIEAYGDGTRLNPFYLAAIDADGRIIVDNLDAAQDALLPDTSELTYEHVQKTGRQAQTLYNPSHSSQWRVIPYLAMVQGSDEPATLLVGLNMNNVNGIIARYTVIFLGFAAAVVVFGAATTQLLVTSTFAPLRDVEATAARFAAGDYSQRLGGATPNTEVGRLNRSLNTMLARIDRAFADRESTVEQMRRFVGDASHELRTPLVSLRGYAELYRMGAIQNPEDVAQAMDRIEREAIRMGALVEDLLELARLDESKPLDLAPVDLLPIAQDAALDASVSAPARHITVIVPEPATVADAEAPEEPAAGEPTVVAAETIVSGAPASTTAWASTLAFAGATLARLRRRRPARADGTPVAPVPEVVPLPEVGPVVLAEENKIRQVVANLIGNAMRFTPDDSPIELAVEVDREGGYGQISIVDHGEGVPPQLREKIFQRFWRADTSRTRDTGGSGLGLAIVAGIVANHDGHVEVLETPGGGATFRVSLPLLLPSVAAEPEVTEAPAPPPKKGIRP
ncbi:MAG TPA: HAMP domain-containing sensor histidine kinase [Pseudolysinimonas sp.]|nr:HAMP domain-containing sensor histidine kinase [Pseudolysinimonas sp.]